MIGIYVIKFYDSLFKQIFVFLPKPIAITITLLALTFVFNDCKTAKYAFIHFKCVKEPNYVVTKSVC